MKAIVPHTSGWEHDYSDPCYASYHWCRIHRFPEWRSGQLEHKYYPDDFNVLSSRHGWQSIRVHCGPGAFRPTRKDMGAPPRIWSKDKV